MAGWLATVVCHSAGCIPFDDQLDDPDPLLVSRSDYQRMKRTGKDDYTTANVL